MNGLAIASSDTTPLHNLLINGGFDYFQRTAPGTPTSRSDDVYGPDRWYHLNQANPVNVERIAGEGPAVNASRTTQANASAQRFGLAQIVEGVESVARRSTTVRFDFRVRMSTGQALRYAVLEWTGTVDAVTSDVVLDWTNGTYTAGNFFLASNLTVAAVGTISPTSATWTSASLSANISASCNNIIVMVWTEGTAAQNIQLDLTRCGLYDGAIGRAWQPPNPHQELDKCLRYYEKSYALATPPGTATSSGALNFTTRTAVSAFVATNSPAYNPVFQAQKRVTPTMVLYEAVAGTANAVNVNANTRTGVTAGAVGTRGFARFDCDNTGSQAIAADNGITIQWTADAEL
jgi:hypothetical protein